MNPTFDPASTYTPQATRKALAVCLLACLLAACGGAGGDAAVPTTAPMGSTAPESTLPGTESPLLPPALTVPTAGGVVAYFKQKLLDDAANTARNALPGNPVTSPGLVGLDTELRGFTTSSSAGATEFASSTLQERGVDEADWVKTDGSLLYGLSQAYTNVVGKFIAPVLQAQRRMADGQLQPVGSISLPSDVNYAGMYLVGAASRIALVSQKVDHSDSVLLPMPMPMPMPMPIQPTPDAQKPASNQTGTVPVFTDIGSITSLPGTFKPPTVTTAIDLVSTPAAGAVTSTLSINNRIRIDGSLVGSRVIGSTLYVVSSWQPNLNAYMMPNATPAQTQAKLASLSAAEILPTIRMDGGPAQPLVAESDCYVQTGNASRQRQVTTITAFNLASSSLQRSSRCFLGGSQAIYMSPAAVYLASSRYFDYRSNIVFAPPAGSKTDIHKFSLAGQNIDYRGSGEVAGHFGWDADKNAYRMSEHNGDLRVLTFTGELGWSINRNGTSANAIAAPAASPATMSVLRETTGTTPGSNSLQVIATLPNAQRPAAIGKPGEQIYAVQFVGPKAYVVTFRRTDPLYVLDLSNPLDPKTVGELEIPGYSDYLVPMGDTLLLGVGRDANTAGVVQGVKIALMDVSDPAKPSLRSSMVLGSRGSASALDSSSRGINIFQQGNVFRIALPVILREPRTANTTGFFGPTTQGLARFEVDTQTKTLTAKPMVTSLTPTSPANNWQYDVAYERSVQIGPFVYYLSGGTFRAAGW